MSERSSDRSARSAGAILLLAVDGTIEGASDRAEALLGEPVLGRPLSELLSAADAAEWNETLDALSGSEACGGTSFVGRVPGVPDEPLVFDLAPLRLANGAPRVVAAVEPDRDTGVDPRVLELLDPVVGALGDICYVDEILADGRHRNLYASERFEAFLGRPIPAGADALAIWRAAVHVEDRLTESAFMAAVARGERAEAEYRVVGPEGTTRRVLNRAWPRREEGRLLVLGIVSELGDDRQAEADADEARRRLADVAGAVDDVFVQVELGPSGPPALRYVSPQASTLLTGTAITPAGLLEGLQETVHEDDRERAAQDYAALLRGEAVDARYRLVVGEADVRHLWVRARAQRSDDRAVVNAVIADVTHHSRPARRPEAGAPTLTPRQGQILGLLADGVSTKAIASRLGLSLRTVQNHVAAILRELESHSRLEAVAKARRLGML